MMLDLTIGPGGTTKFAAAAVYRGDGKLLVIVRETETRADWKMRCNQEPWQEEVRRVFVRRDLRHRFSQALKLLGPGLCLPTNAGEAEPVTLMLVWDPERDEMSEEPLFPVGHAEAAPEVV